MQRRPVRAQLPLGRLAAAAKRRLVWRRAIAAALVCMAVTAMARGGVPPRATKRDAEEASIGAAGGGGEEGQAGAVRAAHAAVDEEPAADAEAEATQDAGNDLWTPADEGFVRAVPEDTMRPGGSEASAFKHGSALRRGCPAQSLHAKNAHDDGRHFYKVRRTWLYRHPEGTNAASTAPRYAHMAMVATLGNGSVVAAWQASDAREGERDQHIVFCSGMHLETAFVDGSGEPFGGPSPGTAPGAGPGAAADGCNRLRHIGGNGAAIWGPVLYAEPFRETAASGASAPQETQRVWLFYSESGRSSPCPGRPMEWAPGGDIRVTTLDVMTREWSEPRTILSQSTDGGIPKVTANKPAVLSTGEWLLPFWRERSMLSTKGPECDRQRGRESAGVLVSSDEGESWNYHEPITTKGTWLIENAIAEGREPGSAVMVFRTQSGVVYATTSPARGEGWTRPRPLSVPNPNSKIDMIRLHPSGDLLLAFNDHKRPMLLRRPEASVHRRRRDLLVNIAKMDRAPITGECKKCRSHLRLALSRDNGATWQRVASLEEEVDSPHELRISYPTLAQRGCDIFVAYSKLYTRQDLVMAEEERERKGVKVRMGRETAVPRVLREDQGIVLAKVTVSA